MMSSITKSDTGWLMQTGRISVRFDPQTLAFSMQREGGRTWRMFGDDSHDLTLQVGDALTPVSLASAAHKEAEEYRSGELHGVRVLLRGFRVGSQSLDVSLALVVALDVVSEEVVVRVIPVRDLASPGTSKGVLGEVRYPRPFELDAVGLGAFHVLPTRQGALLPPDWQGEISWWWIGLCWTPVMYQPWWGALRPGDAYLGILETPYDGGLHLDHPKGGPTHLGPKWHPSMGSLSYARQVRYALFGDVDHNALVSRYREYSRSVGRLKTLETKATEVRSVKELEGVTVAAAYTLHHTQPDSHYYDKEHPERNHTLRPFADTVAGLERLAKAYPAKRLVCHLDGWGARGYDNLHPDILPPCEEAGGWEGFRAVAEKCRELGWLFATHDNYIDYYKDAPTYSDDLAIHSDEKGTVPGKAWWAGGAQSFLCEKNALGYVRRNFEEILRRGVPLTATYIDVFAIYELVECYHRDHRMTRKECAEARAACFQYVRSRNIVLSSEEPVDWSVPYIDFCYWAPLAQANELFGGVPVGIPVPLFNQTYHDCLVTPSSLSGAGPIPAQEMFLYALSFGCAPLIGAPGAQGGLNAVELAKAKVLAEVHRQAGFAPIEKHELLDADGKKRRTTFGGGATVEVDFNKGSYRLQGFKGLRRSWQSVPA